MLQCAPRQCNDTSFATETENLLVICQILRCKCENSELATSTLSKLQAIPHRYWVLMLTTSSERWNCGMQSDDETAGMIRYLK